ncbi:MAG TPA: SDR family oxidoreductase [Rhabdochlamydiaceae bacterium]|nr:SDR family oxidoreductase [Rhabdochlamydiaceae bacterium]
MKANTKAIKCLYIFFILWFFHVACFANRKTIIVTGASGELGGAAARLLASDYDLILTGRNFNKLKQLQEELKSANSGHYEVCTLDFVDNASKENFNDYLKQTDALIAGVVLITPRPHFEGKTVIPDEKIWLEVFQSTFTGPMEVLKVMLPYLSNPSKIVVIAGTTSIQLQPEWGPFCVIRRMWTTYTKALSHQLGPQGISVNALSPGVVLTHFHEERIQKKANENGLSFDDQMEAEVAKIPLRRHAKPKEVAQTIKFLLSEQSDFINGINLVLDGGFTLSY